MVILFTVSYVFQTSLMIQVLHWLLWCKGFICTSLVVKRRVTHFWLWQLHILQLQARSKILKSCTIDKFVRKNKERKDDILSIKRNPFPEINQPLRSYRVYVSPDR